MLSCLHQPCPRYRGAWLSHMEQEHRREGKPDEVARPERTDRDRAWVADQGLELHRLIARRAKRKPQRVGKDETSHEPDRNDV